MPDAVISTFWVKLNPEQGLLVLTFVQSHRHQSRSLCCREMSAGVSDSCGPVAGREQCAGFFWGGYQDFGVEANRNWP